MWAPVVWIVVVLLVVIVLLLAILALSRPRRPPPLRSIVEGIAGIERMPSVPPRPSTFKARDGQALQYRLYPGASDRVAVLIHGSAVPGATMHPLALALSREAATVYALDLRGHAGIGEPGDIGYIGQLEDDVSDFLAHLGPAGSAKRIMLGFSAGAGFTLRFAASPYGDQFDGYLLLTPFLGPRAPTLRPEADWAGLALPRVIVLSLLDGIGLRIWGGLRAVRFALSQDQVTDAAFSPDYSFRMLSNFAPHMDWAGDLKRVSRPVRVLIGDRDEIFYADRMGPTIQGVRPDIPVEIVPGPNHVGLVASTTGTAAAVAAFESLVGDAPASRAA